MRPSVSIAAVLLVLIGTACSSPCVRVEKARQNLFSGAKTSATGPHVEVVVPFAVLDKEMTAAFKGNGDIPLSLPVSGPLKQLLPPLALRPQSIKLRTAQAARIGVLVRADVLLGKETLFSLSVDTEAQLTVDRKTNSAILAVSGEDLQSVRPHLPADAGARLAKSVWPLVPTLLRATVSKKSLGKQLQRTLSQLLEKDFTLTAAPMLKDVGRIVSSKFSLGALPVQEIRLRPDGKNPQLVVEVDFSLPVTSGLPEVGKHPLLKKDVLIRASGATIAALANRAMEDGDLPARYDEKGKPTPNGPFRAGLSWDSGKRPLRIHLFREEGQCVAVTLAGRPTLQLNKGRLTVGVEDATVAETTGEVALQTAIWFRSLWSKAISFSRSTAGATELTLAGKKRRFAVKQAGYDGGAFVFRVGLQ